MQRQRWKAMAVFAFLAPAVLVGCGGSGQLFRPTAADRADAEAREHLIEAELAALDREALPEDHWARQWSGTYHSGYGVGPFAMIKIAPESGFTYSSHGCFGLSGLDHGNIVEAFDDGLLLHSAIDPDAEYPGFMNERIYFVRWGERRYIVPEWLMLHVVNNYNNGMYAWHGLSSPQWYEGDLQHLQELPGPPEGDLQLPEKWASMLLHEPLKLTFTAVKKLRVRRLSRDRVVRRWEVEFAGGRGDGVYEQMEFYIGDKEDRRGTVTIIEVDEDHCRGEVEWYLLRDEKKGPEVGQTVVVGSET